jgi:hypothetical protein
MNNPKSSVSYGGNPAGRPMRRLGIRAALPAKRAEATPGNDRDGALDKLRVCVTPAVDNMTAAAVDTTTAVAVDITTAAAVDTMTAVAVDTTTAVAVDIMTAAAVDAMTAVAVDTTTAAAFDTTTTIDTTIAAGDRNSLSTIDAFDTEPY